MRKLLSTSFISSSLILLSSCSSSNDQQSTVQNQEFLLKDFDASLKKVIVIEGKGVDTVLVTKDSVEWSKELFFLSNIDQLTSARMEITNEFNRDSTLTKSSFIPKDSKNTIKSAMANYGKNTSSYTLEIEKKNFLQNTRKKIKVVFKNYAQQQLIDNYSIEWFQKTASNDSVSYVVNGKIVYQ